LASKTDEIILFRSQLKEFANYGPLKIRLEELEEELLCKTEKVLEAHMQVENCVR
jgi:hypothetical protein